MSDPWNSFWRAGGNPSAVSEAAIAQTELQPVWRDFFTREKNQREQARIIDLGCGSGAVAQEAFDVFDQTGEVHCLDRSFSAVSAARARIPGSYGVAADCDAAPYSAKSFDLVVSQYGAEYAGPAAFVEAARLVAPGGVLCALAHVKEGAIDIECEKSAAIASELIQSGVFPASRAAFGLSDQLRAGTAPQAKVAEAQQTLQRTVKQLEAIIQRNGLEAAGGLPARLYNDLGQMFRRMTAYRTDELLSWCAQFETETTEYAARMTSMQVAALDEDAVRRIEYGLIAEGLSAPPSANTHIVGENGPIAWRIEARRVR